MKSELSKQPNYVFDIHKFAHNTLSHGTKIRLPYSPFYGCALGFSMMGVVVRQWKSFWNAFRFVIMSDYYRIVFRNSPMIANCMSTSHNSIFHLILLGWGRSTSSFHGEHNMMINLAVKSNELYIFRTHIHAWCHGFESQFRLVAGILPNHACMHITGRLRQPGEAKLTRQSCR